MDHQRTKFSSHGDVETVFHEPFNMMKTGEFWKFCLSAKVLPYGLEEDSDEKKVF